ncbi:MAG: NAD-dependent epimerase/dehydratase family protein [Pseudomonadales bacterium]
MPNIIAVTGATGFIGNNLCRRLLTDGFCVRALVRSPTAAQALQQHGVELIPGTLDDRASLVDLADGVAAVIHLAGSVRGATQKQFDRVNVDGVRQLLKVLESAASPPQLLLMSSLAARESQLSYYASSKRRGEQVLQQEANHVNWTALRPPAVYGPGDKELMPLFRLAARGLLPLAGSADARFSLLFVDDLSSAVLAWLHNQQPAQGIYTLDDGTPGGYDWHAVAATVEKVCMRPVRLVALPAWIVDLFANTNNACARLLHYAPMLTPAKLRELRHRDWVCDGTALQTTLNWRPAVTLADGLQPTLGWSVVGD